jgi:hypothetical protein
VGGWGWGRWLKQCIHVSKCKNDKIKKLKIQSLLKLKKEKSIYFLIRKKYRTNTSAKIVYRLKINREHDDKGNWDGQAVRAPREPGLAHTKHRKQ